MYTSGTTITSTGTAVSSPIPLDSQGGFPTAIRVSSSAAAYVRLTNDGTAAVAGDLLVQPGDDVVLWAASFQSISVLSVSGTANVYVHPDDVGQWSGINPTSLNLSFAGASSLDSRITFTRADAVTCATYFDSTGRLQTVAANVARFDYDPATAAGATGGELIASPITTASWGYIQPTSGSVSVSNGVTRVYSADGTLAQFQDNNISMPGGQVLGKTYALTATYTIVSGVAVVLDGLQTVPQATITTSGTYTTYLRAYNTSSPLFIIKRQSGVTDFTVSNISVKEVTFTPRGLLIEESRQNLLLQSRDMTQAAWTKTDVTPARTQVGLDGVANTACLMTEGSAGTAQTIQDAGAVTAGSTVTESMVVKRGNTDWIRIRLLDQSGADGAQAWFNLGTGSKGTVSAVGAGASISSAISNLGGGWYRCTVTCLPNGTYTIPKAVIVSAAADNSTTRVSGATYIVDCAQLEVGSFATSIIPTTTTTRTRAADSASMTGTNFSSWFNASAGTFVVEAGTVSAVAVRSWSVNDTTSSNRLVGQFAGGGSYTPFMTTGGVGQTLAAATGSIAVNAPAKMGTAYDAAGTANSVAGSITTAGAITLPTGITQLNIGSDRNVSIINGHIRSLRFFPTRLPNATLQALTS